eukprot:UN23085
MTTEPPTEVEMMSQIEVKLMSFKSVECKINPSAHRFPHVLTKSPSRGYCVNTEADFSKYSSNRDLCQGVGQNICARFTWVIDTTAKALHFRAHGSHAIDYETAAIYVDGQLVLSGTRHVLQNFDVQFTTSGRTHIIDLYGWEDCCAGNHKEGYAGWTLSKSDDEYFRKSAFSRNSDQGSSSSSNRGSASGDTGESSVHHSPKWALQRREHVTSAPPNTTSEEFSTTIENTTEEPTTLSGQDDSMASSSGPRKTAGKRHRKDPLPLIVDGDGDFQQSMAVIL